MSFIGYYILGMIAGILLVSGVFPYQLPSIWYVWLGKVFCVLLIACIAAGIGMLINIARGIGKES